VIGQRLKVVREHSKNVPKVISAPTSVPTTSKAYTASKGVCPTSAQQDGHESVLVNKKSNTRPPKIAAEATTMYHQRSQEPTVIVKYTSPFETGYALLQGGPEDRIQGSVTPLSREEKPSSHTKVSRVNSHL
jgi:hypothetical protein